MPTLVARPGYSFKIGLNSGLEVVGNVGAPQRYNYTALCETVNVAARLERGPAIRLPHRRRTRDGGPPSPIVSCCASSTRSGSRVRRRRLAFTSCSARSRTPMRVNVTMRRNIEQRSNNIVLGILLPMRSYAARVPCTHISPMSTHRHRWLWRAAAPSCGRRLRQHGMASRQDFEIAVIAHARQAEARRTPKGAWSTSGWRQRRTSGAMGGRGDRGGRPQLRWAYADRRNSLVVSTKWNVAANDPGAALVQVFGRRQ